MSNIVEKNDTTLFSVLEPPSSATCAQEQEVHDLFEFLKLEYRKNIQYNILLNILKEYIQEDSNENKILKEKIKNIILSHSVFQTLVMNSDKCINNEKSLLGIEKLNTTALTFLERNDLQEILKLKLEEQRVLIHKKLSKTEKETIRMEVEKDYSASLQLSSEERVMLSTKQKLLVQQEQYINNLLELQKLLLEISGLRLKKLPDGVEFKIKHSQAQEKINSLKAVFTEQKFRVDIFTESNCSLQAYKELIKDIKEQQKLYEKEIQELEDLKEKYRQVSCKQFDDILTAYHQFKSSLEQKKKLYDYLVS